MRILDGILRTLRTIPLAYPALIAAAIVAVIASSWTAARTGMPRVLAGLLVFSALAIVALTLTPSLPDGPLPVFLTCEGLDPAPSLASLFALRTEHGQNVALFVPLGVLIGIIPIRRARMAVMLGAIVLPFVIEGVQSLLPGWARSCQAWDAVENLIGLAIGLAIGAALGGTARLFGERASEPS